MPVSSEQPPFISNLGHLWGEQPYLGDYLTMVQIFYLHPYLGKISNFDYIIFFNWVGKNHQLVGDDGGLTTAFASGKGCATESNKPRLTTQAMS